MGYKYSTVGYISIYSDNDVSSLTNDLFDFQLASLDNELEFFLRFSAKRFALVALSVYYKYTAIVQTLSFDL